MIKSDIKTDVKTSTIFKILEIGISASIPLIIFILGMQLTRRIEDSKNESAKRYYWNTKWNEIFFEKYKESLEKITVLLSNMELYRNLAQQGKSNDKEAKDLIVNINELSFAVFRATIGLKIQSSNLLGEENTFTKNLDELYLLIAGAINNTGVNLIQIFEKLKELHKNAGEIFDKNIK